MTLAGDDPNTDNGYDGGSTWWQFKINVEQSKSA